MIGSLISAGSSLLGGLFGQSQADKQAKLQKEFAQKGIQWKVADAKAAGIHPLAALGAQTTSYAPTSVGDLGLSSMGQDIGRAVDSARSATGKVGAHNTMTKLAVERSGLENELLKTKIASERRLLTQPGTPPARPEVGGTKPMYIELIDNRPGSKTYGEKVWVPSDEARFDITEAFGKDVERVARPAIDALTYGGQKIMREGKMSLPIKVRPDERIDPSNWMDWLIPSYEYQRGGFKK